MKYYHLLVILTLCITPSVFTQETTNFRINFEFGYNDVPSSIKDEWNIRQDIASGFYDSNNLRVYSDKQASQLAIKPEWLFLHQKLAFETGLMYTHFSSELDMANMSNGLPAYFFLRYENSGINTHFTKVHSISESSHYMSIPLQLRITPYRWSNFEFFIKTGINVGILLATKTNIHFVNKDMNVYQDQVLNAVGLTVNNYYSTWENAIGCVYGDNTLINYRFEILLPSFYLTKNNSTLVNSSTYTGFRVSLQLPIQRKQPTALRKAHKKGIEGL